MSEENGTKYTKVPMPIYATGTNFGGVDSIVIVPRLDKLRMAIRQAVLDVPAGRDERER